MTSASQQAELEKPVARAVWFGEFEFAGGTTRLSTWNHNIDWGGYTWSGLGQLVSISAVEESRGLQSKALQFGLTAAQTSWIALAIGDAEECRGRRAKLYMCPLDEQFQMIDTPELCWQGIMDPPVASYDDDGSGQITLNCETSAFGLRRRAPLRVNAAQLRKKYPTAGGLDYGVDLIANPAVWASKRFQRSQV